jgi:hypothetical protein
VPEPVEALELAADVEAKEENALDHRPIRPGPAELVQAANRLGRTPANSLDLQYEPGKHPQPSTLQLLHCGFSSTTDAVY